MTLTRGKLTAIGIVVVALVVYLLVDLLWVTDEEKLHRLVSRLENAVESHDAEACVALADEESWDWLGTRGELVELLQRLFDTYDVRRVQVVREEVQADPPQGTVHALTVVFLGSRSPFPGPVRNTWLLACIKKDGEWFISRAHVELEGGGVEDLPGLLGRGRSRLPTERR